MIEKYYVGYYKKSNDGIPIPDCFYGTFEEVENFIDGFITDGEKDRLMDLVPQELNDLQSMIDILSNSEYEFKKMIEYHDYMFDGGDVYFRDNNYGNYDILDFEIMDEKEFKKEYEKVKEYYNYYIEYKKEVE